MKIYLHPKCAHTLIAASFTIVKVEVNSNTGTKVGMEEENVV